MSYLIAVLPDRIAAEAAYSALEEAGFSVNQLNLLGRGYKSADEFGLLNPAQSARRQINRLAVWLVPFGFLAGVGFSVLSDLQTFAWAGSLGNHLIGGLLGGVAAAMGSFFVGGGVGLSSSSGDALAYRNRLNAGKYLLILQEDADARIREATRILRQFGPENLQGYSERL
ncbi:MAG: hypothetical protein ACUVRV_02745 [Cyanobacteriota bacterium]